MRKAITVTDFAHKGPKRVGRGTGPQGPKATLKYLQDLAEMLAHLRPDKRSRLEAALKVINEEEARSIRLNAAGKFSDELWDSL